jgi:dTDP-4-dehydrorhamnose 3,5-epimerase
MKFQQCRLAGAYVIDLEPASDQRGFFAQSWSREEFAARGLSADLDECGISFNLRRGTLRGLHYQVAPFEQAKLVRCTVGAVYDVIVDLRPGSPTRDRWEAFELSARNRRLLYVPKGFAHGFQTLCDDTEVFYQMTGKYSAEHAQGIRWDSPGLGIQWPPAFERIVSVRDRRLPMREVA